MTLKIIIDEDFGLQSVPFENPRVRVGARGIVLYHNQVVLLHKKEKNEYKLLGGGLEGEELPEETFLREVLEESGFEVEIVSKLGEIEEWKSLDQFKQISYVFVAKVISDTGVQHYTEKELGEGSEVVITSLEEAIRLVRNSENQLKASQYEGEMSIYHSRFIVRRDLFLLEYYLEHKNNYSN